ncbi:MAG TPA: MG2 domain-containing protein, partial [Candidatus Methylacidiphilales bacterium]|nr:MG2 domain-containing protein [Candidatus Methylacidiphilales bacterium]
MKFPSLTWMLLAIVMLLLVAAPVSPSSAAPPSENEIKAARFYEEKSYAQAAALWAKVLADEKPAKQTERWRELTYRTNDALSRASSSDAPNKEALAALVALTERLPNTTTTDRWGALAFESLGDAPQDASHDDSTNLHYAAARTWWEDQVLSEEARVAWLRLFLKPLRLEQKNILSQIERTNWDPELAETALRLATQKFPFKTNQTPEDVATIRFVYVKSLMRLQNINPASYKKLQAAAEAALAEGKKSKWYDSLLFSLGEYYYYANTPVEDSPGHYKRQSDNVLAVKYYQRLVSEYRAGESEYYDRAKEKIKQLTEPSLGLGNEEAFKTGSLLRLKVETRNLGKVEIRIRKIDLDKLPHLVGENPNLDLHDEESAAALSKIAGPEVRALSVEPKPSQLHDLTHDELTTDPLPGGMYLVRARSGKIEKSTVLLVTNTAVTSVEANGKVIAYVCDATTGLPIANAEVILAENFELDQGNDQSKKIVRTTRAKTNEDGLAELKYAKTQENESQQGSHILAISNEGPAIVSADPDTYSNEARESKAYVYTDSPAYKPGDTVKFRVIYREHDGKGYTTPKGKKMMAVVYSPNGSKLLEKSYDFTEFGSFTDSFDIPKNTPLGAYRISLEAPLKADENFSHSAELFRIEEFKLPEFRVEVKVPEKDGKAVVLRQGDKMRAEILVTYYSGGVVADAEVEYDISQNLFYGDNPWPQPYPWYYQDISSSIPWLSYSKNRGTPQSNIIKRDKIKTNSEGKAYVDYDVPANVDDCIEFIIEARVTDSSRRMVNGRGSIKVSSAPFFIYLKPDSQIYAPGATATVEGKALDANDKPVEMKGTLTLQRKRWVRKVAKNKEGKVLRVVQNNYETKEIERRDIATDKAGLFKVTLPVAEEGYYTVTAVSPAYQGKAISATGSAGRPAQHFVYDPETGTLNPSSANTSTANQASASGDLPERAMGETTFFAATKSTRYLGYRAGELQIIPDKPSYRVGETARLIVISPRSGGATLLSVQGADLVSYKLLRMENTAQLVEVPITEALQPNAMISALSIYKGEMSESREEIIVPPDDHFLNFALTPEKAHMKPGEKGTWTMRVTDHDGKPVQAEVSMAVVDAAIYYIQEDLAGDIREFFYGEKRSFSSNNSSVESMTLEYIEDPKGEKDVTIVEDYSDMTDSESEEVQDESSSYGDSRNTALAATGSMYSLSAATTRAARAPSAPGGQARGRIMNEFVPETGRLPYNGPAATITKAAPMDKSDKEETPDKPLVVRSDFRVSAFWDAAVKTDADGRATLQVAYPESLTEWKAIARGVSKLSQFGNGDGIVKTAQPLMVRLQTPRFVVEGDRFTLTSVINNETDKPVTVKTKIEAKNLDTVHAAPATVTVQPRVQGRAEAEFEAKLSGGSAEITASGTSPEGSDGMRLPLPIVEHGIEKFIARSFVLDVTPDSRDVQAEFTLNVPEKRNPGTTKLDFVITPSLASTCLDALPYLADYPYGCVEQTMSRFLPACAAAHTLKELKLEPEYVAGRLFGGVEPGTAKALHLHKGDLSKLNEMTAKGLARLADFQHDDGGWGWWKADSTNDYMTAYVVQGLALAKKAGVTVPDAMPGRGAAYLNGRLVQYKKDQNNAAWLLYAISLTGPAWLPECQTSAKTTYDNRENLNAYTRSLLALALWEKRQSSPVKGQYEEWARVLIRNLENGVQEVKAESDLIGAGGSATMPVTCFWGDSAAVYYRWHDGTIEATSTALRAMIAIDPTNKRIDQAARWLINNRRGAQWKNTRDTATTVLSMLDYIRATKEGEAELIVEVLLNGELAQSIKIGREESLGTLPINIPDSKLRTGDNKVM